MDRDKLMGMSVEELQRIYEQVLHKQTTVGSNATNPVTLAAAKRRLVKRIMDASDTEPEADVVVDDIVKTCPSCIKTFAKGHDDVERLFGFRTVNGKKRPQSYCRACRAAKSRGDDARLQAAREENAALKRILADTGVEA